MHFESRPIVDPVMAMIYNAAMKLVGKEYAPHAAVRVAIETYQELEKKMVILDGES